MSDSATNLLGGVLFVEGHPAAQGSKAFKGFRNGKPVLLEQSKRVDPWRTAVALVTRQAMRGRPPVAGAVGVGLVFVMPRPKSAPKAAELPATKRIGDLDKLQRAVFDAITSVVVLDDSQIVEVRASKRVARYGERSGVYIEVNEQELP